MRTAVAVTLKVTEGVYSRLRLTGKRLQPEAAHQIPDLPGPSSPSLLALRFAWAHSQHKQSGLTWGVNEMWLQFPRPSRPVPYYFLRLTCAFLAL